jgi:hypothetical protein
LSRTPDSAQQGDSIRDDPGIIPPARLTLLEADSRFAPQLPGAFKRRMINGKPVSIEMVEGKGKGRFA